jgi:hypothetical protein
MGRRGGKSQAIAVLVVYLATIVDHSERLAIGERGVVQVLATNVKQGRVVFNYIAGILNTLPNLARLIVNQTSDTINFSNNIDIEIRAASGKGLRGNTCVAVVCDEISAWVSDENSANPDSEILIAIRPSLGTTDGMLIAISSPYAQQGELWKAYHRHFGFQGDPLILVAQAATQIINPTTKSGSWQRKIDRAYEDDPVAASAEYGAQFRTDECSALFTRRAIEDVTIAGRHELLPRGRNYVAFVDPAGGTGQDSMTMAVAHMEGDIAVLDAVREMRPTFRPNAAVEEFAQLATSYDIIEVTGDNWGTGFVGGRFGDSGIGYIKSKLDKSAIYRELLPLLNSGAIELLDDQRLVAQLAALERQPGKGKDRIDHPTGGHDDVANAVAGALVLAKGIGAEGGGDSLETWVKAFGLTDGFMSLETGQFPTSSGPPQSGPPPWGHGYRR